MSRSTSSRFPLLPLQILMQRMLLNKRTRHSSQHRTPQRSDPHAPERLDIRLDDTVIPAIGQPFNLIDRIPDATNLLRRTRQSAKPPLQPLLEQVLENRRRDRNPDRAARGAESIRRARDDRLVLVLHGRDEGYERDGQHAAVRGAAHEEVEEGRDGVDVWRESS